MQLIKSEKNTVVFMVVIVAAIVILRFMPLAEDFKSIIKAIFLIVILYTGYAMLFETLKSKFETYLEKRVHDILKK
ncbi:hypothetical protein ACMGD3_24095 [Lysinibacillus sphaericus]|uniref:hypothetical protein n=1 Tax=Lysinibacillus sphaericus TaxID=1421 RepID=UPI003F799FFD